MPATEMPPLQSELNRQLVWVGFRQMVPIAMFVMVFGAAFGLAATQSSLDATWVVVMSTLVFAGAAQFATLDLWGPQVPNRTAQCPLAVYALERADERAQPVARAGRFV